MNYKKILKKKFFEILDQAGVTKHITDKKQLGFLFILYEAGFNTGYLLGQKNDFSNLRDEEVN